MADNVKTVKCPACQKEMVKVFLPSEGVNIDMCLNGCGGIYFDNRELAHFDEQHENIDEITKAIEGKTFEKVDENLPRTCPVCGATMVKHYTSAKHEIMIDDCYACGGKFLDNGELQRIRAQYATDAASSEDFTKMLYDSMGAKLKVLNGENATYRANRSSLKKLFDKMLGI